MAFPTWLRDRQGNWQVNRMPEMGPARPRLEASPGRARPFGSRSDEGMLKPRRPRSRSGRA